jgi:hypothetical protein
MVVGRNLGMQGSAHTPEIVKLLHSQWSSGHVVITLPLQSVTVMGLPRACIGYRHVYFNARASLKDWGRGGGGGDPGVMRKDLVVRLFDCFHCPSLPPSPSPSPLSPPPSPPSLPPLPPPSPPTPLPPYPFNTRDVIIAKCIMG